MEEIPGANGISYALYARLGFVHVDDRDFFGYRMTHMVRELDLGDAEQEDCKGGDGTVDGIGNEFPLTLPRP